MAAHSVWKFLRYKVCCIGNWLSRHERLEAHSCKWQRVMKSWYLSAIVPRWGTSTVTHSIPLHHFTQPCLSFPLPSELLKEVKAELRWRKGNSWNVALLRSLPSRVFPLVFFHKEGGWRGAQCVRFVTVFTHIEIATWVMGCSTAPQAQEWKGFFSARYWRHCVPDTLTYLAELNRLKLTGHPASLKIFHIVRTSFHLLTNINKQYCSVATIFQFNSNRPLGKALYRIIVRKPSKTKVDLL